MPYYIAILAFLGAIGWLTYALLYVRLKGIRTEAVISSVEEKHTGDGTFYYPVVTFQTQAGASVTAQSKTGFEQTQSYFRPGSRITIFYLAAEPSRFIIQGYDAAGLIIMLVFAFAALLLALYITQ